MTAWVFLSFRLLERLENLVADRDSIRQAFQPRNEFFKLAMAEVTLPDARRQDQCNKDSHVRCP